MPETRRHFFCERSHLLLERKQNYSTLWNLGTVRPFAEKKIVGLLRHLRTRPQKRPCVSRKRRSCMKGCSTKDSRGTHLILTSRVITLGTVLYALSLPFAFFYCCLFSQVFPFTTHRITNYHIAWLTFLLFFYLFPSFLPAI